MLRRILLSATVLMATSAIVAHADPKDDITAGIQKVSDAASYSWSSTTEGGFGAGTTTGKTQKDGFTAVTIPMRDDSYDIVVKGDKAAVKTADGWKMASDILAAPQDDNGGGGGGGGFNPDRMMAMRAQTFKTPTAQVQAWLDQLQNIQKGDDAYSADLSADAAKQQLSFRPRPAQGGDNNNNNGPEVKDAKASVKFWITDGSVTKMELHVTGTITFNDNDRDIDRTTTTEFKDVGSTTVDVPDEVKSKF
jgi:hypothetical protein